MYYCANHDYEYYDSSWVDESTGRTYPAGYYDEKGQYYEHVVINENGKCTTDVTCEYCGSMVKLNWTEGAEPNCPNCGAPLGHQVKNVINDSAVPRNTSPGINDNYDYPGTGGYYSYTPPKKKSKIGWIIAVIFLILAGIGSAINGSDSDTDDIHTNPGSTMGTDYSDNDSIYVDNIGRTCYFMPEYDSYYDEESDCYFVLDEDGENPEWKYWYEGISSDYGDDGWMEYDDAETQWYIEETSGNWVPLPKKYSTDGLWHINAPAIYVKEIDRICDYLDDMHCYYDVDTDCYFAYNDWVEKPVWQYWYEGISSDYDESGWMEYIEDEKQWYIEDDEGNWVALPDTYDTERLWHIKK